MRPGTEPLADRHRAVARCLPTTGLTYIDFTKSVSGRSFCSNQEAQFFIEVSVILCRHLILIKSKGKRLVFGGKGDSPFYESIKKDSNQSYILHVVAVCSYRNEFFKE